MNTVAGFSLMTFSIASASACNCGIWSGETSHEPVAKLMVLMSTLRTRSRSSTLSRISSSE